MGERPTYDQLLDGLYHLWNAVVCATRHHPAIGHEGSELLEVMSEAHDLVDRGRRSVPAGIVRGEGWDEAMAESRRIAPGPGAVGFVLRDPGDCSILAEPRDLGELGAEAGRLCRDGVEGEYPIERAGVLRGTLAIEGDAWKVEGPGVVMSPGCIIV